MGIGSKVSDKHRLLLLHSQNLITLYGGIKMELTQAIKERCCIRNFSDKKPEKNKIKAILEAARLAPSWVNVQPWHFIVVDDKETIETLGAVAYDQPHVTNAKTLIVCCGTIDSWNDDKYKEIILSRPNISEEKVNFLLNTPAFNPKRLDENAVLMRTTEEVTYAIAYMTLEIENQGLSGCIIGGMGNPLTRSNLEIYETAKRKLELPEEIFIAAMLVVGYPAEEKPPKIRKDFSEVVSYNKYRQTFTN
jgi:nitroreductase